MDVEYGMLEWNAYDQEDLLGPGIRCVRRLDIWYFRSYSPLLGSFLNKLAVLSETSYWNGK